MPRRYFNPDDMADAATVVVAGWLRAWFCQHETLENDAMNQLRVTMRVWAKEWLEALSDEESPLQ